VHTSLEKNKNCGLVNHHHFRLVSSTKVQIGLVIVFIYKDTFSSRLSLVLVTEKRSLTNIFRHSFRQRSEHWCDREKEKRREIKSVCVCVEMCVKKATVCKDSVRVCARAVCVCVCVCVILQCWRGQYRCVYGARSP